MVAANSAREGLVADYDRAMREAELATKEYAVHRLNVMLAGQGYVSGLELSQWGFDRKGAESILQTQADLATLRSEQAYRETTGVRGFFNNVERYYGRAGDTLIESMEGSDSEWGATATAFAGLSLQTFGGMLNIPRQRDIRIAESQAYQDLGLSPLESWYISSARRLPILGSVVAGEEMVVGASSSPLESFRELNGWDYAQRGLRVGGEAVLWGTAAYTALRPASTTAMAAEESIPSSAASLEAKLASRSMTRAEWQVYSRLQRIGPQGVAARAEQVLGGYISRIPASQRGNAATVVAAYDRSTGLIAIGRNGSIPGVVAPQLVASAKAQGGVGNGVSITLANGRTSTLTVGRCAEFRAANSLLLRSPTPRLSNIGFTNAIRPRTGAIVPPCINCEQMFWLPYLTGQ